MTPKVTGLIKYFSRVMPEPESELVYDGIYQLVVAVVLSAQCTDKRVNIITPHVFEKYGDFAALADAEQKDLFLLIKSCTYPNSKSLHLIAMAKTVMERFHGVFPESRDEMETLPGVGRKTANVVSAVAFNKPYFAVDTHVFRVANRLGLVKAKTPLETEKQLEKLFPPEVIPDAHHWLLLHGRYCCTAQKPHCETCGISALCDFFKK
ncbi:MAG: endonuclease III [Bacteroidales bacterium]|nr:endonuclease III [Bacteroidales bacterium]